mgnify:CR=1 FL=1
MCKSDLRRKDIVNLDSPHDPNECVRELSSQNKDFHAKKKPTCIKILEIQRKRNSEGNAPEINVVELQLS